MYCSSVVLLCSGWLLMRWKCSDAGCGIVLRDAAELNWSKSVVHSVFSCTIPVFLLICRLEKLLSIHVPCLSVWMLCSYFSFSNLLPVSSLLVLNSFSTPHHDTIQALCTPSRDPSPLLPLLLPPLPLLPLLSPLLLLLLLLVTFYSPSAGKQTASKYSQQIARDTREH